MAQDTKAAATTTSPPGFEVTGWIHALGGFIARHPRAWIKMGNWETRLLADTIDDTAVNGPIYVAGLARSGSTILLELLATHAQITTHRYRDYPFIYTPYWWNRWLDRVPKKDQQAVERTHGDGIAVTSESPEAFEEILWMTYFPDLHNPEHSSVLGKDHSDPGFERFYRDHMRKLLAVRGGRRYAAKGNYNVTRLGYLQRISPDARLIVPVRDPVWHVASLMKQHALFIRGQGTHPKAREHLQRVGHFEFGLDRRPINPGDGHATADVQSLWKKGEEVRGWARYWAMIHGHVCDRLDNDPDLREATLVVRFEDLCREPRSMLKNVFDHCALPVDDAFVDSAAGRIHFPSYYQPRFSDDEMAIIRTETAETARRLGYA